MVKDSTWDLVWDIVSVVMLACLLVVLATIGRNAGFWTAFHVATMFVVAYLIGCWHTRKHLGRIARLRASRESSPEPDAGHPHLVGGEFQSDKCPACPRGKVPLSCKDKLAQPLLWQYAELHRPIDEQFSVDLEIALRNQGYVPEAEAAREP